MTIDAIHKLLARDALGEHPNDEDALGLMVLLPMHRICLREPILTDGREIGSGRDHTTPCVRDYGCRVARSPGCQTHRSSLLVLCV
jgi:hypothetical protein